MKKLLLTLGVVSALSACGSDGDEFIARVKSFRDATCACKDIACLDKVEKEIEAYKAKATKTYKGKKPTEAQRDAFKKLQDEMEACDEKIYLAAADAKAAVSLGKMTGFMDAACACTDAACATKVKTEMIAWVEADSEDTSLGDPSEALAMQLREVSMKMGDCLRKVITPPEAPPAPPVP